MKLKDLLEKVDRVEPLKTLEDVLLMPLSQFKKAGLLVRVPCDHLTGGDYYIASTERESKIGRAEGLVTYTADELVQLTKGKPSPDELRTLHELKKIFGGMLTETRGRRDINATN